MINAARITTIVQHREDDDIEILSNANAGAIGGELLMYSRIEGAEGKGMVGRRCEREEKKTKTFGGRGVHDIDAPPGRPCVVWRGRLSLFGEKMP